MWVEIWVVSNFLATMNNAAMYIHLQIFVWTSVFISFGYAGRSSRGVVGSYGNSMFKLFGELKNFSKAAVLFLHSYQQCRSVPVSPHSCTHFICIEAILGAVKWYLIVQLICISTK